MSANRKLACFLAVAVAVGGEKAHGECAWDEHYLGEDASLRGISVLDDQVIWTSGSEGTVYKTENGGESWRKIIVPGGELLDFRDVEVLSAEEVVIMSAGLGKQSAIFKSRDGGETWAKVFEGSDPEEFYDGFAFWNVGEGILGGDPVDGEMFLLETSNGGDAWQRIDPGLLPPLNEGESGGFAASGSHLAVMGNSVWISSAFAGARVTFSNDKGSTWSVTGTPIIQREKTQGIFSMAFLDEETGVAVGGDYRQEGEGRNNVILTDDGGRSWRLAEGFPVFQSAVGYLSPGELVSVGPKAGYYSDDSGNTWHSIEGNGYHTLSISKDGDTWAAGRGGRVARLVVHRSCSTR